MGQPHAALANASPSPGMVVPNSNEVAPHATATICTGARNPTANSSAISAITCTTWNGRSLFG
nr:hypothetical protein [Nocardia amikacinitolerans]